MGNALTGAEDTQCNGVKSAGNESELSLIVPPKSIVGLLPYTPSDKFEKRLLIGTNLFQCYTRRLQ